MGNFHLKVPFQSPDILTKKNILLKFLQHIILIQQFGLKQVVQLKKMTKHTNKKEIERHC